MTAPTPCAYCGAKPKFQLSITDIVLTHTQFVNISVRQLGLGALYSPDDYICYSCYKLHLVILQQIESKFTFSDSALKGNMDIWVAKVGDGDTDEPTRAV